MLLKMVDLLRIRELAKETLEYANSSEMNKRRKAWTQHNSLNFSKPLIYIRAIPFDEFCDKQEFLCLDPYYRSLERDFLINRYRMQLEDDYIIEPFLTVRAAMKTSQLGVYGLTANLTGKVHGEAAAYEPSIVNEEDIEKLCVADYVIDRKQTEEKYQKLYEAVGEILDIEVDCQGVLCSMWQNDISTTLAKLRGLEQIMWDAYDRPEWFHRLLGFMRDKILLHIQQTEQNKGFKLINHQNQAMPYAQELAPPMANKPCVSPKELWGYMAAQEYTTFGPDLFNEFMFEYQKPILESYGLVAYGCCEDLTQKIEII